MGPPNKTMAATAAALAAVWTGYLVHSHHSSGPPASFTGTVTHVNDGDTIKVDKTTVRLLGVDTPETKDPRKPVQCYGPEASAFTHGYAEGQTATVRTESSTGDTTDRYGRTLGYVTIHRRDLGATLLRKGYATVYQFGGRRFRKLDRYERLEEQARAGLLGRWGACP